MCASQSMPSRLLGSSETEGAGDNRPESRSPATWRGWSRGDGGGAGGRSGKGEGERGGSTHSTGGLSNLIRCFLCWTQREGRLRKLVGLAQKPVAGEGQDTATGICFPFHQLEIVHDKLFVSQHTLSMAPRTSIATAHLTWPVMETPLVTLHSLIRIRFCQRLDNVLTSKSM